MLGGRRWRIYPLDDGTLQAAPEMPTWGGAGILVEEVSRGDTMVHVVTNGSEIDSVWSDEGAAQSQAEKLNGPGGLMLAWSVVSKEVQGGEGLDPGAPAGFGDKRAVPGVSR